MTIANTNVDAVKQDHRYSGSRLWSSIRYKWTVQAPVLIMLVALWICLVDNTTLWSELAVRLSPITGSSAGYAVTLLGLMVLLLVLPMLIVAQRYLLKPLLVLILGVSGVLGYFTTQLGVVYDMEMVRNITETIRDRNSQEGLELLSMSMFWFLLPTTVLPALVVLSVRVEYGSLWRDMFRRFAWGAGLSVLVLALVMINFKYVTYFSRENNDLEVYLNPFYPMKTTKQLLSRLHKARNYVFTELGDDAVQVGDARTRTVGIVVVGETARRGNFSLNGYGRDTNPELARHQIVNFSNATSCGTSTAYSVPCMFSFLNQVDYTPEKADKQSTVLDVLQKAGVKTVWVDSNSSCKGVCNRIENTNLLTDADTANPLFVDGAWHDEVLLEQVDKYLDNSTDDVLLVLHSMGSHGPAYYRRYPDEFARFKPYCQSKAPQVCPQQLIVNAYDNTILYTDHVLASLIDKLAMRNDHSFLLYASDHGESLGENGVFLHGLPRFVAPAAQTEIPMIAWFSPEMISSRGWASLPNRAIQADLPVTHDNISASLLGLYHVQTSLYEPALDLFTDEKKIDDKYSMANGRQSGLDTGTAARSVLSQ